MTSNASTVDEYLAEVPAERRDALDRIRALIRETHPGFEEGMEYGMPSYSQGGTVQVGFASQRQNIALYILKEGVVNRYRDRFAKSAVGKGCIRLRNPEKIDFGLLQEILEAAYASDEAPC